MTLLMEMADKSLLKRFAAKVLVNPYGCWNWVGCANSEGYGDFWIYGANIRAHRTSWRLFKGEIPSGLTIDHLCRNRKCVNPAHLEPVTKRENVLRGEGLCAVNAKKTHCPKGHIYSGPNLAVYGRNRKCRRCICERDKRFRKKNPIYKILRGMIYRHLLLDEKNKTKTAKPGEG